MTKAHTTRRRVDSMDENTKDMIYKGCNVSQLAMLFGLDNRTISMKIHEVPADDQRNGTAIWKVKNVAPYLVKPILEVEQYIKQMHPQDLPKHLSKEFWTAQNAMLDVKKKQGDLWPTERVIKTIGGLFKQIKIATKLMNDQVDTQAELTVAQRRIIKQLNDSMLNLLFSEVTEAFKPNEKENLPSNDEVIAEAERMIANARAYMPEDDDEL